MNITLSLPITLHQLPGKESDEYIVKRVRLLDADDEEKDIGTIRFGRAHRHWEARPLLGPYWPDLWETETDVITQIIENRVMFPNTAV